MDSLILYLHGFRSSPESWKVRELRAALAARGQDQQLLAPALPNSPAAAMALCESLLARAGKQPVTVVGSSLGGYYATWLAEKHNLKAVLINPAVIAHLVLEPYLGIQTNLHTGEPFEFTRAHVTELQALEISAPDPAHYLLLVETGDQVLDYQQAVKHYAGCKQVILEGGDHSFTQFPRLIPQILEFASL